MKTLTQILDEKAKEKGFRDWNNLLAYTYEAKVLNEIISSAALEYDEQGSKAFAEWIRRNNYSPALNEKWILMDIKKPMNTKRFTTTELYHSEEFKKFKEGK